MEVTQAPVAHPSGNPINKKHASSQTAHIHEIGAEPAIVERLKSYKPWRQKARLVRMMAALVFTTILLTLAPVKAEYKPAAYGDAAETRANIIPETINGLWDDGVFSQEPALTYISAYESPLTKASGFAQENPEHIDYAIFPGVGEIFANTPDIYEINVDNAQLESFLTAENFDETEPFNIFDAQDIVTGDIPGEFSEQPQPVDEAPAAYSPIRVGPSLASLSAAAPISPSGTGPLTESTDSEGAAAVPGAESRDASQSDGDDITQSDIVDTTQAGNESLSETPEAADTPQPSTASTGSYIWPAYGNLTSPFGYRNATVGSTNHKGIDICANTGDPIYAADAGEVTFSGLNGSFGNLVEIKHDNGHKTLYAHCSSLLVSVGERVAQGQKIALMGRTGRATAVHLHFELIIKGENVDPELYLK